MSYGIDRWMRHKELTSSDNQFVINEGGADIVVSLDAGDYWVYFADSGANEILGYPSLFLELITKLNAAAANTYTLQAAQPSGTSLTDYRAIQLVRTAGSADFDIVFSSGSFTLDKRLFGVGANHAADVSNVGASTPALGQIWGQWVSKRHARRKIGYAYGALAFSTEDFARDDAYVMSHTLRRRRLIQYTHVPPALVHKYRAELADYAETAGVSTGDTRQAFEHIWESMRLLRDVIILHDEGDESTAFDAIQDHSDKIELARLLSGDAARDFGNVAELDAIGGEFHSLMIPIVHIGGDYEQ